MLRSNKELWLAFTSHVTSCFNQLKCFISTYVGTASLKKIYDFGSSLELWLINGPFSDLKTSHVTCNNHYQTLL